uniref:Transmembrane protein n=1 Tax=Pithovirus LCPAC304 TaxID=2506594 RepID=A0A481Z8L1_9VIRU|nr:MAG: hypothetical protein LCPAC304_02780 [Pithovirus LCPAC304]
MFGMEFIVGLVLGVLGFALYDVLKCSLWMKRIIIHVERCPETKFILEKSVSENLVDKIEVEDEDLEEVIAKVRQSENKQRLKKVSKKDTTTGIDQLFTEVKALSNDLMKRFSEEDVTTLFSTSDMSGLNKMLKFFSTGEYPSPEDLKHLQEELADSLQTMFCGKLTDLEKEEERKDSEIVLNRLQEIHKEFTQEVS